MLTNGFHELQTLAAYPELVQGLDARVVFDPLKSLAPIKEHQIQLRISIIIGVLNDRSDQI